MVSGSLDDVASAPAMPHVIGVLDDWQATADIDAIVDRALRLTAAGVTLVDVPAGDCASPEGSPDGADRAILLVGALVDAGLAVSVTTSDADTALLASGRGARYVNDPSGGSDVLLPRVLAETGGELVVGTHGIGEATDCRAALRRLEERLRSVQDGGVAASRLLVEWSIVPLTASERDVPLSEQLALAAELGYRVVVDARSPAVLEPLAPGRDEHELHSAALALYALAAAADAWAVRVSGGNQAIVSLLGVLNAHARSGGGHDVSAYRTDANDGVVIDGGN